MHWALQEKKERAYTSPQSKFACCLRGDIQEDNLRPETKVSQLKFHIFFLQSQKCFLLVVIGHKEIRRLLHSIQHVNCCFNKTKEKVCPYESVDIGPGMRRGYI